MHRDRLPVLPRAVHFEKAPPVECQPRPRFTSIFNNLPTKGVTLSVDRQLNRDCHFLGEFFGSWGAAFLTELIAI
jgi:hypothetical protein